MAPSTGEGSDKTSMRILVISNNPSDKNELVDYLRSRNFQTACMSDPINVNRHLVHDKPDLVVLDLVRDNDEHLRLLNEIRSHPNTPVIAIIGQGSIAFDRATTLDLGVDDCLTRPFGPHELVARIRAIVRRLPVQQAIRSPTGKVNYCFAGWHLELRHRRLTNSKGMRVELTVGEYALLLAFLKTPKRPLTREFLAQATHLHHDVASRSVDVQVMRLRRKLATDPTTRDLIKTKLGIGYVFNAPVKPDSQAMGALHEHLITMAVNR
jgi:two-component system OmpR family response regulator